MGVREGSVFGPGFFICGMCGVRVVVKRVRIEIKHTTRLYHCRLVNILPRKL